MDPLTAAFLAITEIVKSWSALIAAATPEQRQQIIQMQLDDMKAWREFIKPLVAVFAKKEGEQHVRDRERENTGAGEANQ